MPVNFTISPLLNPCELKEKTADPDDAVGDSAALELSSSVNNKSVKEVESSVTLSVEVIGALSTADCVF